jgi:hypothetical protein
MTMPRVVRYNFPKLLEGQSKVLGTAQMLATGEKLCRRVHDCVIGKAKKLFRMLAVFGEGIAVENDLQQ